MGTRSHFWILVHRRALREAAVALGLGTKSQIMSRVLVALIIIGALVYFGSPDAARDEVVMRAALLCAIFLGILPLMYLWKMASIPAVMHGELTLENAKNIEELTKVVTPRIELSISSEPFEEIAFGNFSESPFTGSRQSVIFNQETVLRINCKNTSGLRIDRCKTNLVDVRAIDPDGAEIDIGFNETLPLSWTRIPKMTTEIDMEPGTTRLLYLAAFRPGGILLFQYEGHSLPTECHHLFSQHQRFCLWIQVNGARDAAARICIEIEKKEDTKQLMVKKIRPDPCDYRLELPSGGA